MEDIIKTIEGRIQSDRGNVGLLSDYFECVKHITRKNKKRGYTYNAVLRMHLEDAMGIVSLGKELRRINEMFRESYRLEALDVLDSYLIFLEWDRDPKRRFYLPRRRRLLSVVKDLQDLSDRVIKFLGVSLPPRVGKSTLCIFFLTWWMGKHPEAANVMSGHSDKLTSGFYEEVLSIITNRVDYLWHEVFPDVTLSDKSAKDETIDLGHKRRFSTLTCRSVDGTLTGAVEVSEDGILYTDDLIEDLEESLNPSRLENKYNAYLNQLKDRKKDGALELMVGTRWNVEDPLGRIQAQYEGDPEYRFTVIPALDENGESNFVYDYGLGFSTEYYLDMKESIDDATFCAKYQGQPYVREGLLFPEGELNRYNGTLPGGDPSKGEGVSLEPSRIMAACDVAWGGGDFVDMPIAYLYDGAVYIHDVVHSDRDKTVTQPLVAGKLILHKPHQARFEGNNGGHEYASDVDELLHKEGVSVNISSRRSPPTASKLSRIIRYAPDIKRWYFIDDKHASPEYRAFMRILTTFTVSGKNKHDDPPDALAQLAALIESDYGTVRVMQRPC